MNFDEYNEVINGENTYEMIAKTLCNEGKCIIGWTDQECDHRDILFTYKPIHLGGALQRGLRWCYLYISIIDMSCMGFLIEDGYYKDGFWIKPNNKKYDGYIKEKLRLHNNPCDDKICELINGVIEKLDDLNENRFQE